MKKITLIALAAVTILSIGCKKEKEGKILSPDEQKNYIEETAIEAINMSDLDYWKPNADFTIEAINLIDRVEPDDATGQYMNSVNKSFDQSEYKRLIDFSKISGNFSISKDTVLTRAAADDLTLAWNSEDGSACNAAIDIKSSESSIMYSSRTSTEDGKEVTYEYWVNIPKSVNFNAKKAGKEMADFGVTTDLKFSGNVPDEEKDDYSVTAYVKFADYVIEVTRAHYSTSEIATVASFRKGDANIFKVDLLAKGKLAFEADGDPDMGKTSGTVKVSGSVLDKVIVNGNLDYDKYLAATSKEYPNTMEGATAFAADLEASLNITLTCDKREQAKFGVEAVTETHDDGEIEYDVIPVIRFTDGSAYQLPEDFFSEESFKGVIDALQTLIDKVDAYLGGE